MIQTRLERVQCGSQDDREVPQGVTQVGSLGVHFLECWRTLISGHCHILELTQAIQGKVHRWQPSLWSPRRRVCKKNHLWSSSCDQAAVKPPQGVVLGEAVRGHLLLVTKTAEKSPSYCRSPMRWVHVTRRRHLFLLHVPPAPSGDKVSDWTRWQGEIFIESTSIIGEHKERVDSELRSNKLITDINGTWKKIFIDIKTEIPRI